LSIKAFFLLSVGGVLSYYTAFSEKSKGLCEEGEKGLQFFRRRGIMAVRWAALAKWADALKGRGGFPLREREERI
jgi:hypothetical protein